MFKFICAVLLAATTWLGATAASAQSVLLLAAESDATYIADVSAKLTATGRFTSVTAINASASTPSLATLQTYDAVLVWANTGFQDGNALGDNLHDYAVSGGGVVVGVFASASVPIGGRFATNGDSPIVPTGQGQYVPLTLGTVAEPAHPLMAGVNSFSGGTTSWHSTGTVKPGATLVASWSNGRPLIVAGTVGTTPIVGLGFWPPSRDARSDQWDPATDGAVIMANALTFVARPTVAAVPTLSEWAMILFGTVLAGGAALYLQRRRKFA